MLDVEEALLALLPPPRRPPRKEEDEDFEDEEEGGGGVVELLLEGSPEPPLGMSSKSPERELLERDGLDLGEIVLADEVEEGGGGNCA